MPFLDWVNKAQATQVAAAVPYHLLEFQSAHGDENADNLLIQGDNLLALKALLPFYRGQVKCIYIDPPYNTQSAFEHYDDKLEHSQWLSMMHPRLVLLRELLAEDGSIWVSIDDNEGHYLKVLMDEAFGRSNFLCGIAWEKRYSPPPDTKEFGYIHDLILCYRKTPAFRRNLLPLTEDQTGRYQNKDGDPRGAWKAMDYTCRYNADERPNLYYAIKQPNTGEEIWPKRTRVWAMSKEVHEKNVAEGRIWWGVSGNNSVPALKNFLSEINQGMMPMSLWKHGLAGHTQDAKKEMLALFGEEPFGTPKPESLLHTILHVATNPNDLVLDSFLGSGTTAAVAHKMGRRWIGIEMGEHAVTHCLPRLEKVGAGETGGISAAVGWQGGGGFRFHRLGEAVFDAEGGINPAVRFASLAAYLWHFETGQPAAQAFDSPCLGTHEDTAYYLLYNGILGDRRPAGGNVLTSNVLAHLDALFPHAGPRVIYGETTRLGEARLREAGIVFEQDSLRHQGALTMFALKSYQVAALEALEGFFERVRSVGLAAAWTEKVPEGTQRAGYDATALGEVPAVCVRIPTGGGKTLLAAHAVGRIGKPLCGNDAPVVLWLVPSDAIRTQTLVALQSPRHPCRQALAGQFGDALRVCALDELATVNPHESSAIVVVATIQTFNVRDKTIRNVYAVDESLAPHFQALTPQQTKRLDCITEADLAAQPYLTAADLNKVKSSLANWLVLHRPLVIVDEAHNNRTEQAFRTLRNLHPLGLIELTATPTAGSNVIWHVGAQALQREEMIKLPIVLMEHPTGWKDAVRDAILTRDRLETLALKEADYIRPVLLFQAEAKNGEATVEALLAHLTSADGEKLDRRQIAVATGEQKELDGIVLADPGCPIRYVITVEALKEGWDCPFAYVLCSLQDAKSAKDVEQLLGRVLRMPYARVRATPDLNKAYAHIVAQGFARVADQLADRLVNNMGFEAYEAALAIQQAPLPLANGQADVQPIPPRAVEAAIPLPAVPVQAVPASLAPMLEIRPTANGATALVRGEISTEVEDFLLTACTPKQQPAMREAIERERLRQAAQLSPSARGIPFAPLPQLCFLWEGELQPVERRVLAELGDFDLSAEALNLAGFALTENGPVFEIELDGGRVHYHVAEPEQLYLDQVPAHASENDLVRWLDRECRQPDVAQAAMLKWLLALIRHLIADRGFTLTALVRAKYPLAAAVRAEIERRRGKAVSAGFQKSLPGLVAAPALEDSFRYAFAFHPDRYPARPPFYSGRYRFQKHYYPVIHDLREKRADGAPAEEFLCARAIDTNPAIKHWVRNVERDERFSFWLPTATDYFYPDFVCELTDGRVLVVEYKGEHLLNAQASEKAQIGHQWETSSSERCLFLLARIQDDEGRDVAQQIAAKIAGT